MKILKRILLGVLSVVCVGAMAVGFAGCEKECAHEWESVVLKQATCTENGLRTKVCTLCGDDFSEIIPALGHDYINHEEKSATCTQDGWESYQTCSRCAYSTYVKIPAFGHNYINHICEYCDDILASDGLNFTLNEDEKSYSVFQGTFAEAQLFIPNTYNGLPVTSIGNSAFDGCASLTSVEIPNSVTSIGNSAFFRCESLTRVVIPDSVTSIGDYAFSNCTSLTFNTYGNCKYLGNENNPYLALIEVSNRNYSSYTIHEETRVIGNSAFSYCTSLTSVVIPDSVTTIGDSAFFRCYGLTSVVIPDSVTSIGNYAFIDCSSLTSISVSKDNENYQSIDGNLYSKDGKTLIQYAIGKTATSFTVLDSVTSIGNYAFSDCSSLTSIVIPDSVTSIGTSAFYNCTSLTSIEFTGTVAQWKAISKSYYWKYNVPATEVVCKDGTVAI